MEDTRGLHIGSSGKYIFAVSQHTNEIYTYKIDYETSELKLVRTQETLKGPAWIISVAK